MSNAENYKIWAEDSRRGLDFYTGLLTVMGGVDRVVLEERNRQQGYVFRMTTDELRLAVKESGVVVDYDLTPEESVNKAIDTREDAVIAFGAVGVALFKPMTYSEMLSYSQMSDTDIF